MITVRTTQIYEQERAALGELPQPLLPHAGERRFQAALISDVMYWRLILAGSALAFWAGSGFGLVGSAVGGLAAGFVSVAAASLAYGCLTLGYGEKEVEGGVSFRHATGKLALLTAAFSVLGCLFGGGSAIVGLGIGFSFSVFFWICGQVPPLSRLLACGLGVGPVLAIPCIMAKAKSSSSDLATYGFIATGLGIAVLAAYLSITSKRRFSPLQLGRIFSYFGCALMAAIRVDGPWPWFGTIFVVGLTLAMLERWIASQRSFAPVVVTVIILQLSGGLYTGSKMNGVLPLQMLAVVVVFALVSFAGYRYALAQLQRLPIATYRSSPLCIVARLDRAQDYPLKIDAL